LLIKSRLRRDMARDEFSMSLQQWLSRAKFKWHGVKLNHPDWSEHSHAIGIEVESLTGSIRMYYIINAYSDALNFELPKLNGDVRWKRWIDTSLPSPEDICAWEDAPEFSGKMYKAIDHSMVVLIHKSPLEEARQ